MGASERVRRSGAGAAGAAASAGGVGLHELRRRRKPGIAQLNQAIVFPPPQKSARDGARMALRASELASEAASERAMER